MWVKSKGKYSPVARLMVTSARSMGAEPPTGRRTADCGESRTSPTFRPVRSPEGGPVQILRPVQGRERRGISP